MKVLRTSFFVLVALCFMGSGIAFGGGSVGKFIKKWDTTTKKYGVAKKAPYNEIKQLLEDLDEAITRSQMASKAYDTQMKKRQAVDKKIVKYLQQINDKLGNSKKDKAALASIQGFHKRTNRKPYRAQEWKAVGKTLPQKTHKISKKLYKKYQVRDAIEKDLAEARNNLRYAKKNSTCFIIRSKEKKMDLDDFRTKDMYNLQKELVNLLNDACKQ